MLQILKRYHKLIIFMIMLVSVIFFLQFRYSSNLLQSLNEEKVEASMRQINTDLDLWFFAQEEVIRSAALFISLVDNEAMILSFLTETLQNNPQMNSIYYLSTDNQMINATGFIPPPDIDMRDRPWYAKAINKQKLTYTQPFVNATKDDTIVSLAKPVTNQENKIVGVVSADISLLVLSDILQQNTRIPGAVSFLTDRWENPIISSDGMVSQKPYISHLVGEAFFYNTRWQNEDGFITSALLSDKEWILLFFVPLSYMTQSTDTLRAFLISSLLVFFSAMILLIIVQKRMITEPLVAMERAINHDLKTERNNFASLFENSSDAIAFVDRENRVVDINTKFTKVFKYTLEEMKGIDIDLLIVSDEKMEEAKGFTEDLFRDKVESIETIRFDRDGNPVDVEVKGVPILLEGEIVGGYASYTDIRARKKAEREILHISYHDQLTGVRNRRYFEQRIKELDASENLPLTIIMADLNGLKIANDAFGHALGDKLLISTAKILQEYLGENDFVARIGGDEFLIVMPQTDDDRARKYVNKVSKIIKDNSIDLSVSFGWDTKSHIDERISDIMNKAENYMYKRKLSEGPSMISNTIKIIINTLHEKNERERQHSERVSRICIEIGRALNFDQEKLSELKLVGLMHDIGKIGIDENILNKDGGLTNSEYEEIKKHPEIGYRILSSTNEMSDLAVYTLAHHERWDGKGYPKGIKGLQIPLVSRIIAVADAYDAMTSERPYRDAQSVEYALQELKKNAGTQFDPMIVDVFIEKVQKNIVD